MLAQNNLFVGVGTLSTQSSTVDKGNPKTQSPLLMDRANHDLRPAPGSPAIDADADAGAASTGVSLAAT